MGAKILFGALPAFVLNGSGDGSGYGYGSGSGYGDGSGSGSGSGSGYGDGSGYGSGYWQQLFEKISSPRLDELRADPEVSFALWKSDANGKACNGGKSQEAARPGLVEEIKGPLTICTRQALHATLQPEKHSGDRIWLVALFGEVQAQGDKRGALKREIICEVTEREAA